MAERARATEKDTGPKFVQGTPKELMGFSYDQDSYGLGEQPMTAFSIPDAEEKGARNYFAFLHHPLSGIHFEQILNEVAPHPQGIEGIAADFNEAKNSHRKASYGEKKGGKLDRMHRFDPDIGAAYSEFLASHAEKWKHALRNQQYNSVFKTAKRVRYTFNVQGFVDQLAEQWRRDPAQHGDDLLLRTHNQMREAVLDLRPEQFADFLRKDPDFLKGVRNVPTTTNGIINRYDDLHGYVRRKSPFLHDYIKSLKPSEIRALILEDLNRSSSPTIDTVGKKVYGGPKEVQIGFSNHGAVKISNEEAGSITLVPQMDWDAEFDWRIASYDLAPPTGSHLYALWAWRRDRWHRRRFLQQEEATKILKTTGIHQPHTDVVLGRVAAVFLYPRVSGYWEDRISVQINRNGKRSRKQEIGPAQVGAWVSMSHHSKELLEDDQFEQLEEAVA